ncbi:putative oxidoreductase [Methanocella paludicola SANAE]|uniref:Oxidoreductase n=1 Tax=Methanocella paludicola (strain DSM 17711 / JCM 13418 / NBRC 101707 / SANAE) TaxID=304371 RepID=D1YWZ5_METPS|nr:UDP-N-acetylglucosamine 3-dehydrogenase [Methanocella paludicola]BAI60967.1 putative oxidoreductase [Methanocella paludicola SANAE]
MRVGVIGAGAMGQNHIRMYSQMPNVELVGISDIDNNRVNKLSKQFNTMGFTEYEELLKQDLDAVSIVVPTLLHKKVALAAINANTNLLVEKPISDTIENARTIVSAAQKENLTLMVGHIERFNPAVTKMKEIIDSGELGRVVSISARRVGPNNPRIRDVGVILDIGVHDIDIISYLYNSPATEVYAIAGSEIHPHEDHATIMLRFNDNRAGLVETNWLTPHKTRNFTVIGTEGVGYGDYIEEKVFIHDKDWIKEAKVEKKEPLRCELEGFIHSCKYGDAPLTTGEDGINALKTALAAVQSYKTSSAIEVSSVEGSSAIYEEKGKATS